MPLQAYCAIQLSSTTYKVVVLKLVLHAKAFQGWSAQRPRCPDYHAWHKCCRAARCICHLAAAAWPERIRLGQWWQGMGQWLGWEVLEELLKQRVCTHLLSSPLLRLSNHLLQQSMEAGVGRRGRSGVCGFACLGPRRYAWAHSGTLGSLHGNLQWVGSS
jgi:hypothetical protein